MKVNWLEFLFFISLFFGVSSLTIFMFDAFVSIGYIWLFIDGIIFFILFFSFKQIRQFVLKALDFSVMLIPRTYLFLLLGILFFVIIQYILIGMWGVDDSSQQPAQLGLGQDSEAHWLKSLLFFISIALLTPMKEELLFRGIIHRFLEQRYHFWIGFIVSSVFFGFMHDGFPLSAICMGMILVLLYRLTQSLIPSILLHIFWNSFVSLILMNA